MGYSVSWAAVRGKPANVAWAEVGLRATGRTADVPEDRFCSVALEGGWIVLLATHDERFVGDALLSSLSMGCETVACFIEEHVMLSHAAAWRDGSRQWSVTHDARKGLDHLEVSGTPPPPLAALEATARASHQAQPEGPDYLFDVPVDLAKAVAGFRHDECRLTFQALEPLKRKN